MKIDWSSLLHYIGLKKKTDNEFIESEGLWSKHSLEVIIYLVFVIPYLISEIFS